MCLGEWYPGWADPGCPGGTAAGGATSGGGTDRTEWRPARLQCPVGRVLQNHRQTQGGGGYRGRHEEQGAFFVKYFTFKVSKASMTVGRMTTKSLKHDLEATNVLSKITLTNKLNLDPS